VRLILAGALPSKSLWYLTRGSGAVSLLLLTASLVLGLVTTVGATTDALPRFVVQALHRNISLLVTVFVAIHVATSVADSFVPISWIDALVPLHASYRSLWTGLGALAFDLLLALIVTSLVRVRIGARAWRLVHWTAYACWPIAFVHGLGTGSDSQRTWMLVLDSACLVAVVGSLWWRLAARRPAQPRFLLGAGVASVIVPLAICVWTVRGPLQPDWGHSTAASTTPASALDALVPGVVDTFRGGFTQEPGTAAGEVTVRVTAPLDADPSLTLFVDIVGRSKSSGLAVQSATVSVSDGVEEMVGPMSALTGTRIGATLARPDGRRVAVTVDLRFDAATSAATGSVTLTEATS